MDQQEIGANANSSAGQKSSSESQLQHHTSTENAVNNSGQLLQLQQQQPQQQQHYSSADVRMKRHPELQPYIPCDRFVPTITPARSAIKNSFGGSSNLATTGHVYTGLSKDNNSNNKPKKYVSMTRLNQLAQPKRRTQQQQQQPTSTVPPSSLTSSNATSTTASSLASSKNYSSNSGKSCASTSATIKQHLQPRPAALPSQTRRLSSNSLKNNKPMSNTTTTMSTTRTRESTSSAKSSTPLVAARNTSQQQQQNLQATSKTPHTSTTTSTSIRRISRQLLKESTPLRHDLTFDSSNKPVGEDDPISPIKVMSTANQQELTPKVELDAETSSKNHRTLSINDSQDEGSLNRQKITNANGSQQQLLISNNISDRSSSNHVNDNSSNFASIRQANDDGSVSLADQLSELSVNDRHFQSAASELLVPEHFQFSESLASNRNASSSSSSPHASQNNQSSTTNNGTVNLSDRNPDSLLRELQNDIMAKGFAFDQTTNGENFDGAITPRASVANELLADNLLLQQHESTSTLWRPEKARTNNDPNLDTPRAENGITTGDAAATANAWQLSEKLRREREDAEEEERKLKSEEYLREKARREEEEREKRGKLVESILSRFSQGSP